MSPGKPWGVLIAAAALTLVGLCLVTLTDPWGVATRMTLLLLGQLAAWTAVTIRFRTSLTDLTNRLTSAAVVAAAALLMLAASYAVGTAWESGGLLLFVLAVVAFAGAGVVALPSMGRRVVVSVLVVLHFGGIAVAITSAPPGAARPPWLANQLWAYVYRHYLQFMSLGETYHLFSPEPLETPFVWFHLRYADGGGQWVKLPRRDRSANGLDFHRHLKLVEVTGFRRSGPDPMMADLNTLFENRKRLGLFVPLSPAPFLQTVPVATPQGGGPLAAVAHLSVATTRLHPIPTPALPPTDQYAEPTPYSRWVLASMVRHVARTHATLNGKPLVEVLAYRGRHRVALPEELAAGLDPFDETLYQPIFMGQYLRHPKTQDFELASRKVEFDLASGELVVAEQDALLYWMIPIVHEEPLDLAEKFEPFPATRLPPGRIIPPPTPIRNYVRVQAGDLAGKEPGW